MHQSSYIERLKELNVLAIFEQFCSARAHLTCLIHTRPDICAAAKMLVQVTEESMDIKHVKEFNKVVKHLKTSSIQRLRMQKVDRKYLHLRVYADFSFANNSDLTSQLGYIVLLAEKFGKCNILHYASYRIRRTNRSVLVTEVYAFADAFEFPYRMRHDLENLLGQRIPLQMFTDSKSLFDVIKKNSTTAERRLMTDIKDVREAYEQQRISNVGFVCSENNLTDAFTKEKPCDALNRILSNGFIDLHVEE